jgi:hypothetical protein
MKVSFALAFVLVFAGMAHAQSGPCTETAVAKENLRPADDAFSYMPPYGKPVIGQPAIQTANKENFSKRTNITRSWAADHRVVAAPSGDMAYEQGTLHMGYDENGKHETFDAVMLTVFKAKDGACQIVALTMQPLEAETGK